MFGQCLQIQPKEMFWGLELCWGVQGVVTDPGSPPESRGGLGGGSEPACDRETALILQPTGELPGCRTDLLAARPRLCG